MKAWHGIVMAAVVLVCAEARAEGLALGGRLGTLGLGGDLTLRIHERVNLRGSVNWLKFNADGKVDDIDFDYGLDLSSYGGLVDYHPFANAFRLSGGIFFGSSRTTLKAKPSKPQKIGDHTYTPEQIGTLDGKVEFDRSPAPYIGIGYGNAVGESQRLSFIFDLGVVFQSYKTTLEADGMASHVPQFQEDVEKLRQDVEDTVDKFKIYPVLSFGLAYQF